MTRLLRFRPAPPRPDLTVAQILDWADAFQARFGRWPTYQDGGAGLPDTTWCALDSCLRRGHRGLNPGSSLAQLLLTHRGRQHAHRRPALTPALILSWADAHHARTGAWPDQYSGPVNRTTWVYDELNRVTTETSPQNASATFAYDAAGRKTSETDRLGRRRDFNYDDANRVLTEKWYAVGGALSQTQTWTYDAVGRMLTAQDPDGTYTLAYDAANRVTSAKEPFALVLTMGYDAVGNRTSVQDSKGGYTTVTFDALNRQTSEQTAGSGVSAMRFDYAYTARGEVSSVTRYSNLAGSSVVGTTTHDYDAAGRETHLVQKNGSGTILANYTYTYDAGDRMTSKIENGTTTSYSYDAADQLTADGAATFGYDATGNRTNAGYVTDTGNRMTSDGLWTWTYDAAGNVTKRSKGASSDTWVYTYDNRNQMVTAAYSSTDGGTVTQRVTYVYDAFGNRIERDYWDGSTTTVERYGVDGWDPAKSMPVGNENFDTWVDLDGSNNLTMRRTFGTRFDELLARQTSGGTVLWYLTDIQQSVRLLSDNAGSVVGTIAYSAFGQVTSSSGTTDRYRYTSREADAATALQFNRGRFYDPASGKWTSVDPKGFAAGDVNLYRYVENQATTKSDPSGFTLYLSQHNYSAWKKFADQHPGIQLFDMGNGYYQVIVEPAARNEQYYNTVAEFLKDSGYDADTRGKALNAMYDGYIAFPHPDYSHALDYVLIKGRLNNPSDVQNLSKNGYADLAQLVANLQLFMPSMTVQWKQGSDQNIIVFSGKNGKSALSIADAQKLLKDLAGLKLEQTQQLTKCQQQLAKPPLVPAPKVCEPPLGDVKLLGPQKNDGGRLEDKQIVYFVGSVLIGIGLFRAGWMLWPTKAPVAPAAPAAAAPATELATLRQEAATISNTLKDIDKDVATCESLYAFAISLRNLEAAERLRKALDNYALARKLQVDRLDVIIQRIAVLTKP
jgi:RHS repeat-associated protein